MGDQEEIKLTMFSHGSGCGCKISPAVLDDILKNNKPSPVFKDLLVGNESRDDAAVLDLGNGQALISTTDFFMPVVDDAFDFGRIAAANAISDVYAMGGKPVLAVAILGWPVEKIPASLAGKVIDGARKICSEAGIPLGGGHSIDSPEPIFGLAVNGIVDIKNLKKNIGAKPGDLLFITKPVGVGIINTAMKRGKALKEDADNAIAWMATLNSFGEIAGRMPWVHALTDVTGFGLFGHLIEMTEGSNLSAEINIDAVPLLNNLNFYLDQFIFPDMTTRNFNSYKDKLPELTGRQLFIGCDPQTSGGLLIAVDPAHEIDFMEIIKENRLADIVKKPIGKMISKSEKVILLK